jgi:hypothetical protein
MKIKTLPVTGALLCLLTLCFAFVKKADDPVDKLVSVLQRWTDSIPQEKVYLHMDKPYYALGDTIWFKGYVTIGSRHQLSALSGAVYVDLITAHDSLVRSLKLPVTSGMVMGNFIFGDDLKEGSYRIRAYTQWMRNAGEEYFFDRTFAVGNVATDNVVTKANYQYKDSYNSQVLTALLNYTDDEGRALGERNVRYQVVIGNKVVRIQSVKTDALGTIQININNTERVDLNGAYIRTTIEDNSKRVISRNFPIKAALSQTDVQFFPESGSLVNGIPSRVAFKALGIDGLGTAVKGIVVDNNGNEIAPIETLHAGMGNFTLRPEAGKSYSAKITFADESAKNIALPKATDQGYVLSVYQPGTDSVLVRIAAPAALQQSTVSLIVQVSGESIFASPIKISKAITSVWLGKKDFPTGIAQFTLFNTADEPLNERIAFVRSNDQMQLAVKTAKTGYKSKEAVWVELDAKDSKGKPAFGNFSVTVIDENKVPEEESNESTIFSNILLTADLKGYVEQPNYYFTNVSDEVNRALDNLMLTQGYRRFSWKELEKTVNTRPAYEVEGLGFKVSGTVQTLGHKILPDARVTLLSVKAGVTKVTTTDSLGRFKFDGIFLTDSIKFAIQARGATGTDKVKIILDTLPHTRLSKNRNWGDVSVDISNTLKAYIANGKKLDDIYEKTGQLDRVQRLKEVRIRARKLKPDLNITPQGMFRVPNEQSADKIITFDENEAANSNTLAMALQAKLPGIQVISNMGYSTLKNMRGPFNTIGVILDGRKLNSADEVSEVLDGGILPGDVAKILLVRTNQAMVNILGGEYILIMTKLGSARKQYNPSIANISPKGFNKVREFYSPKYNKPGADKLPDLRSTIYWSPYLKTAADGKTTFSYFNADGPGNYKVIVEGINAAGELGRQVYRYTVDGSQATLANFTLPKPEKNLAMITDPLDNFNKRQPVEKVYLHTDKPYYNIGDTLWFKAYLVDRLNFAGSKMSGLLYVELDNDSSEVVRRISVPVKDGLAWGQIPLPGAIFHEGGFTLRAYTNWMQNIGDDGFFKQRFYLGVPAEEQWLIKSDATVNRVGNSDLLQVDLKLNHANKTAYPVAFKKVEIKVYDDWHYLYKEKLQTNLDGSLSLTQRLKDKTDLRQMRIQITSLDKADGIKIIQVPLDIKRNQNIDLQFLPESGHLVAGIKSVVGFKAIAENGNSTPVLGSVYDSKNIEVLSFASTHNGMGTFEFVPKAGEIYTARVSQPAGVLKAYKLPVIDSAGTVMHVTNREKAENITVNIYSAKLPVTDSAYYLVGTSRGSMYYSQKIDINKPDISISKNIFPSGVTRLTLFKGKRPLNERMVFINVTDQLAINITANKTDFLKRDSVGLEITVKDKSGMPVKGSFSLAVTDDSQVIPDSLGNNSIAASLLLNSELRGNIESPGYYINRKDTAAWHALDNLMLTQGWTGYSWKDVFAPANPIKYKIEKDFRVTGHVVDYKRRPLINTTVTILSEKPSFVGATRTDSSGRYEFTNLPRIDSGAFTLRASNTKGKLLADGFGGLGVDKFSPPKIPSKLREQVMPWYVNTDSVQANYVVKRIEKAHEADLKLTGNVLKEVKIRAKKIIKGSRSPYGLGKADLAFDEQEIKESGITNLYELLRQKIPGFKVIADNRENKGLPTIRIGRYRVNLLPPLGTMDLRVDGSPLYTRLMPGDSLASYFTPPEALIDALSEFPVSLFRGLEVTYRPETVSQSRRYYFAKIELTTFHGLGRFAEEFPGIARYRPLPVDYPELFYSPRYNVKTKSTVADYRSTLYWEPNISTDINGKAKVSFFTSDIKGKYTVNLTGIDETGGIGDAQIKINQVPRLAN